MRPRLGWDRTGGVPFLEAIDGSGQQFRGAIWHVLWLVL